MLWYCHLINPIEFQALCCMLYMHYLILNFQKFYEMVSPFAHEKKLVAEHFKKMAQTTE